MSLLRDHHDLADDMPACDVRERGGGVGEREVRSITGRRLPSAASGQSKVVDPGAERAES